MVSPVLSHTPSIVVQLLIKEKILRIVVATEAVSAEAGGAIACVGVDGVVGTVHDDGPDREVLGALNREVLDQRLEPTRRYWTYYVQRLV